MGEALIHISLGGATSEMAVATIPALTDLCALGMDFAEQFGFTIHARDRKICMADEPLIKFFSG